ncbi:MAG: hypothetical protein ACK45B_10690 [Limisphaerales bacterium]|jgi:hypothetical protein
MSASQLILFAAVTVVLAGCGKEPAKKEPASNPLTAPVDYIGAATRAQQHADKTLDLATLRQAIQMFQMEEGRLPKELNELVTEGYLPRLPAPPPGQQIIYDAASGAVRVMAKPAATTPPPR